MSERGFRGFTLLTALLWVVALYGFSPLEAVMPFTAARGLELVLLLIFSAILIWRAPVMSRRSVGLWAVFFGLGLLSAWRARYPLDALQEWAHTLWLLLGVMGAAALFGTRWVMAARVLCLAIAVGMACVLFRFAVQWGLTLTLGIYSPLVQWWQPYANPRFFAQAVVWCLPLLTAAWVWISAARAVRWAHAALCVGVWTLLFWSGSRAEMGALVAAALGLWWVLPAARGYAQRLLLHAVMGALLWGVSRAMVGWDGITDGGMSIFRADGSGRGLVYAMAWEWTALHPWLGVGPGHFAAFQLLPPPLFLPAHPHNILLQIGSEWGVPALGVFVGGIGAGLWRLWGCARDAVAAPAGITNAPAVLRLALFVTGLAVLAASMLDGVMVMPLSLLLGIPVLGLAMAAAQPLEDHRENACAASRGGRWAYAALVLGCAAVVLSRVAVQRDCITYPASAEARIGGNVGDDSPRFWVQGRIPYEADCLEAGRYVDGVDTLMGRRVDEPVQDEYWR